MKGQVAFEALGALSDGLILEAVEVLGFSEDASPAFAAPRRRERTALSRFFGTGWGVALLCAVVSLSVLGGIIWAGQRPPAGGPGGSETETAADETLDYMGEEQTDVCVRSGSETVYPRKFFVWSGPADGYGFHDFVTQQGREPILPCIYVTEGEDCGIILANRYYLLKSVTAYDENLQPVIEANASGQNWSFASFIGNLPAGTYHVSLYVEYAKNGQPLSGADYACTVVVKDETADTEEIISGEEAMEIASAYWNIQSGETSPDNGFTYRIECQKTHVTPGGETVYVVLWRWFVDGHHWSTVDVIWVDCVTGEVIIPYENLPTGS